MSLSSHISEVLHLLHKKLGRIQIDDQYKTRVPIVEVFVYRYYSVHRRQHFHPPFDIATNRILRLMGVRSFHTFRQNKLRSAVAEGANENS